MPDRRAVFITGAGKNIGRSIALHFADSGYDVVVNGLRDEAACAAVADEVRTRGVRAHHLMGDIGAAAEARRIADAALSAFGAIDVLVANAAIRLRTGFLDITEQEWRHVLGTNLDGTVFLSQAFLPGMVSRKWGRLIFMTGRNAIRGAVSASVAASKHGVWGLTKVLAKEFGPHGITVNTVSPGWIRTEKEGEDLTERHKAAAREIPAGRIGTPDEIADLCRYLASDGAGFINGQMIGVNGGVET